jgi:hypothetical protein
LWRRWDFTCQKHINSAIQVAMSRLERAQALLFVVEAHIVERT